MRTLRLLCTIWFTTLAVYGVSEAAEIGWKASGTGGAVAAGGAGAVAAGFFLPEEGGQAAHAGGGPLFSPSHNRLGSLNHRAAKTHMLFQCPQGGGQKPFGGRGGPRGSQRAERVF